MAKKKKVNKGEKLKDCLAKAREALTKTDPDELNEYLSRVFTRAKDYDPNQGFDSIKKAMGEINNEHLEGLTNRVAITARNTAKFETGLKYLKKGLTLRSLSIVTTKNKDYNIENAQSVAQLELKKEVLQNFDRDEIKKWQSGKLDEQIAAAASGDKVKDPLAQKIGELYKKYPEEIRNPKMVSSDALSIDEIRDDRFLRHIHDAQRLYNAGESLVKRALSLEKVDVEKSKKIWFDDIMKELDLEATAKNAGLFDLDGNIDMEKMKNFVNRAYDNIVSNRNIIFTRSTVANDREALAKRKRMFFVFKDWSAFQRYNKKYGRGNLFQALMADIHSSGNQIGMARLFGDNPYSMYNDLRAQQQKIKPVTPLKQFETDGLFNQLTGANKTAWSPTLANVGASLRAWSSLSRLGMIVFNSLNDITAAGNISQRFGYSFFKPYVDQILDVFGAMPDPERRLLAKQLNLGIKSSIGHTGRFVEATNMGEVMSKMSNGFYWINLMDSWSGGLKQMGTTNIGRALGEDSSKSFKQLRDQTRYQLEQFGINEAEWDALRSKTKNRFFTLSNVDDITSAELAKLYAQSDKNVPLSEYRGHLNRKVYGIFDYVSNNMALEPGAYERMISTWNIAPGTIPGEAVRSVMQFKSYPVNYFRKAWYGGMADMQGAQGKLMYALSMAGSNFVLGYISLILTNLMMGKTTPDIKHLKLTDFAIAIAPGLGTFVKILDPRNQNPGLVGSLILTPSVRLFSDPIAAAAAVATGNFKEAKKSARDFLRYSNPINTIPIAEPYWNQLLGETPRLEPTQRQLFGA
jgi:hypothetical protein